MAWSNMRDGGDPSPSILDECSRPGGRGATFSVDGCSRRSAEVPVNQSSFPSYLRQTLTVPSSFRRGELPRRLRAPFARNVIPGAYAADRDRGRSRTDFALPDGTFFDIGMVHLLTTATLDRLQELYPQGRFEARQFRPNIVVQLRSGEKDFAENAWVGHTLAIGTAVRLNITGPCGRCVMTTLAQGDLPRDPGILRTAAQHNQVSVGVYAAVARAGTIRRGDPIRLD